MLKELMSIRYADETCDMLFSGKLFHKADIFMDFYRPIKNALFGNSSYESEWYIAEKIYWCADSAKDKFLYNFGTQFVSENLHKVAENLV